MLMQSRASQWGENKHNMSHVSSEVHGFVGKLETKKWMKGS